MYTRENALKEWLQDTLNQSTFHITPLAGDASFRRYFRVQYKDTSLVVMDAPPVQEDLLPFLHVAQRFENAEIHTPKIIAKDLNQGFLLLSDLGDLLLLNALKTDAPDAHYQHAIQTLFKIQSCPIDDPKIPPFDKHHMLKEMNLCIDWFFKAYLHLQLSQEERLLVTQTMEWIATEVAKQPLTFIHRDYHSRNLLLIKNNEKFIMGVIDFQDAMRGPITYDLVSLLKDCYIYWPRVKSLEWLRFFYEHHSIANHYPFSEFIRAFDLCGLQRHLKVLGVFCRLHLRDNKPKYLKDLPLTLKYVLECTEIYKELQPFYHFLQARISLP